MSNDNILISLNKLKQLNARIQPSPCSSLSSSIQLFQTINHIFLHLPFKILKTQKESNKPLKPLPLTQNKNFLTPSREILSSIAPLNESPFSEFNLSSIKTPIVSILMTPNQNPRIHSSKKKKFKESLLKLKKLFENSRPSVSHKNFNDLMYLELAFNETSRVYRGLKEKCLHWSWNRLFEDTKIKEKEDLLRAKLISEKLQWMKKIKAFFYWKFEIFKKKRAKEIIYTWVKKQETIDKIHGFQRIILEFLRKKHFLKNITQGVSIFNRIFNRKLLNLFCWNKLKEESEKIKDKIIKNQGNILLGFKTLNFIIRIKQMIVKEFALNRLIILKKEDPYTINSFYGKIAFIITNSFQKTIQNSFNHIRMVHFQRISAKIAINQRNTLKKTLHKIEITYKKFFFMRFRNIISKNTSLQKFSLILPLFFLSRKKLAFFQIKQIIANSAKICISLNYNDKTIEKKEKNQNYITAGYALMILLTRIHQNSQFIINSTFFNSLKRQNLHMKEKNREKSQKLLLGLINLSFFFNRAIVNNEKKSLQFAFGIILKYNNSLKTKEIRLKRNEKIAFILKRIFLVNRKISLFHSFQLIRHYIKPIYIYKSPIKMNINSEPVKPQISDIFAEKLNQIKKKFALYEDKENGCINKSNTKIYKEIPMQIPFIRKELNPHFLKDDPINIKKPHVYKIT